MIRLRLALGSVALLAAVLFCLSAAAAPLCVTAVEGVPTVHQEPARCLVAAAVAAAAPWGAELEERAIAREVVLHPDGADVFDLQRVLEKNGLETLAIQGDVALVASLLTAGVAPVAMVGAATRKHAVVVRAVRWVRDGERCGSVAAALEVMDPGQGRARWVPVETFARRQVAGQLLLVFAGGGRARLLAAGIDVAALAEQDRRFRARSWVLRASEHGEANSQVVTLLERAVTVDPCWSEARALLVRAHRELGDEQGAKRAEDQNGCIGANGIGEGDALR